jgi:hypothetical protein
VATAGGLTTAITWVLALSDEADFASVPTGPCALGVKDAKLTQKLGQL